MLRYLPNLVAELDHDHFYSSSHVKELASDTKRLVQVTVIYSRLFVCVARLYYLFHMSLQALTALFLELGLLCWLAGHLLLGFPALVVRCVD